MQCVILAAGRGTRMGALTDTQPKPLITVAGKPIIEHIAAALPPAITELVIIVGYKGEMIRDYCGEEFLGRKVTYCEQKNPVGGTGDALKCAEPILNGTFLFMYGDDIHGSQALAEAVTHDHAMLSARSEHPERYGVLVQNEDGTLNEIIEKPKQPPSNLINIGGFVITTDIFKYPCNTAGSGECYVTDMLSLYAKDHPVTILVQDTWIPIGYPEDIARAEALLAKGE